MYVEKPGDRIPGIVYRFLHRGAVFRAHLVFRGRRVVRATDAPVSTGEGRKPLGTVARAARVWLLHRALLSLSVAAAPYRCCTRIAAALVSLGCTPIRTVLHSYRCCTASEPFGRMARCCTVRFSSTRCSRPGGKQTVARKTATPAERLRRQLSNMVTTFSGLSNEQCI